jgi:hypothetical protein
MPSQEDLSLIVTGSLRVDGRTSHVGKWRLAQSAQNTRVGNEPLETVRRDHLHVTSIRDGLDVEQEIVGLGLVGNVWGDETQ